MNNKHLTGYEIAVIGMAGKFPGANNITEYWDNLKNGVESVSFLDSDELESVESSFKDNPNYVNSKGGKITGSGYFDEEFFGYTPTEAELMDPQVRFLHECAWKALEDAGYNSFDFKGDIGVYAGASSNFYWEAMSYLSDKTKSMGNLMSQLLSDKDYLSTRLAYKLNLKGQSVTLATACSTSLYAIHLAARSLLTGENDMALAGGVSISSRKSKGYLYQEGMINSKDGHCRPFDESATGTVSGEGVGFVLLKSYDRALEDGDNIYALIKGSAANNDGLNKIGFTAPSVQGQSKVIRAAHHMAEVDAESVSYVEAHGTGTALGDPTEINALTEAFNINKTNLCALGSVKSNIGHLDAAAGVASFIKVVLAIKNRQIPKSLNFNKPNPNIAFERTPFYVNTKLQDWQSENNPLRAGVSSFGIGGTNVHMVLEEDMNSVSKNDSDSDKLLLFSANSKEQLDELIEDNMEFFRINSKICLEDAAYTLKVGRRSHKFKKIFSTNSIEQVLELYKNNNPKFTKSFVSESKDKPLCFMFPGVGSQYQGMAKDLYCGEDIFKKYVDDCIKEINKIVNYKFEEYLFTDQNESKQINIDDFELGQLLTFTVEYSLAKLFIEWGIKPDYLLGYSFGEFTAACISGIFNLSDAVWLIIERAKLIKSLPKSKMLSVPMSYEDVKKEISSDLKVAIDNGSSTIIVGNEFEIDKIHDKFREKRLLCMEVKNQYPIHSKFVSPIVEEFKLLLSKININSPEIKLLSNTTGSWVDDEKITQIDYWVDHLANTVLFSSCINELLKIEDIIMLEVGPGRSLSNLVMQHSNKELTQFVLNSLPTQEEEKNSDHYLQSKLGQLWLYGYDIDWRKIQSNGGLHRISLPTFPFKKHKYLSEADFSSTLSESGNKANTEELTRKPIDEWYYTSSWNRKPLISETGRNKDGICMLIANDHILNSGILDSLSYIHEKIILVVDGNINTNIENVEHIIDLSDNDCYNNIFKTIVSQSITPDIIYHCLTYSNDDTNNDSSTINDKGIFNILYLIKALTKQKVKSVKLNIISNYFFDVFGGEKVIPLKATLYGAIKVIQQEYTFIQAKIIDINLDSDQYNQESIISIFKSEYVNKINENNIAYRGKYRWVKNYNTVEIKTDAKIMLQKEGCYLITGGTGRIGLTLTKYLTKNWEAKVILLSRKDIPPRNEWNSYLEDETADADTKKKIQELKSIVDNGGRILTIKCDVSKLEEVKNAISIGNQNYGKINGVIHAAGITRGKSLFCDIDTITTAELHEQFEPKIQGLINLTEVVTESNIDFFLSISSLSPILGGLGFYAYAAANSFLDFYTIQQNSLSPTKWAVVNWADWKFDSENQHFSSNENLSISPEEGIQNFQHILSNLNIGQIVISAVSLKQRIEKWVNLVSIRQESQDDLKSNSEKRIRPQLLNEYTEPSNEQELSLERIWSEFFGYDKIGINDSFFELGGDSLKAMQILSLINKEFNIIIKIKDFFRNSTIKLMADIIQNQPNVDMNKFPNVEKKEYYPITPPQRNLYYVEEVFQNNNLYNEPRKIKLPPDTSIHKLKDVINKIIQRHESLRTYFVKVDDNLYQRIETSIDFHIHEVSCKKEDLSEQIQQFIKPFDLSKAPLMRAEILNLGNDEKILLIDIHHIIADGVSLNIFWKELFALYQEKELSEINTQYKDFVSLLSSDEVKAENEEFWLNELKDLPKFLELPHSKVSGNGDRMGEGIEPYTVGCDEKKIITDIIQKENSTLYSFIVSTFYLLLSKVSGQLDIIIGAVINGRSLEAFDDTIGMFANTIPFRINSSGEQTFVQLLNEVMDKSPSLFEKQHFDVEQLAAKLNIEKKMGQNPFTNIIVGADANGGDKKPNQNLNFNVISTNSSRFDLMLIYSEEDDQINFSLKYSTSYIDHTTAQKIVKYYSILLDQIYKNPYAKIDEINLLQDKQQSQLLNNVSIQSVDIDTIDSNQGTEIAEFDF